MKLVDKTLFISIFCNCFDAHLLLFVLVNSLTFVTNEAYIKDGMETFFQSALWKSIQIDVLGKQSFTFSYHNKTFWWIRKTRKFGFLRISWLQVLGFPAHMLDDARLLSDALGRGQDDWWSVVFLQLGCDSIFDRFSVKKLRDDSYVEAIREQRLWLEAHMKKKNYTISFRENMPLSTVVTPCDVSDQSLLGQMHSMLRRNLKKANKQSLVFGEADRNDALSYYDLWSNISIYKDIGIMTKASFLQLYDYFDRHDCGRLFVARDHAGHVCAGSLVAFWGDTLVYLYGAWSREISWSHVYVQHEIMKWWRENGYRYFDHWWSYPTGFDDHHLYWVGRFKERFGGEKIEYSGNYDIVMKPLIYRGMKWYYRGK